MPTFRSINIHLDLQKRLVTSDGRPFASPQALLSQPSRAVRFRQGHERDRQKTLSIPEEQLEELRSQVAQAVVRKRRAAHEPRVEGGMSSSIPGSTCLESLLKQEVEDIQSFYDISLSTGSKNLDQLISRLLPPLVPSRLHEEALLDAPGLLLGTLLQICGPPGSGKTQIALHIATSPHLVSCTYLTLAPKSLSRRLVAVLSCHSPEPAPVLANRIHMGAVKDAVSLLNALQGWEDSKPRGPNLLVVDTLSFLVGASADEELKDEIVWTLGKFARQYRDTAVVVLNGTVAGGEKPALRRYAERLGEIQLFVREGIATLVRHPDRERVGATSVFGISPCGICDVS